MPDTIAATRDEVAALKKSVLDAGLTPESLYAACETLRSHSVPATELIEALSHDDVRSITNALYNTMGNNKSRLRYFESPACMWRVSVVELYTIFGPAIQKPSFLTQLKIMSIQQPNWPTALRVMQKAHVDAIYGNARKRGSRQDGSWVAYHVNVAISRLHSTDEEKESGKERDLDEEGEQDEAGEEGDDEELDAAMIQAALDNQLHALCPSIMADPFVPASVHPKEAATEANSDWVESSNNADQVSALSFKKLEAIWKPRAESTIFNADTVDRVLQALNPDCGKWQIMNTLCIRHDVPFILPEEFTLLPDQTQVTPLFSSNEQWGLFILYPSTRQCVIYDPFNSKSTCTQWREQMSKAMALHGHGEWQYTTWLTVPRLNYEDTKYSCIDVLVYAIHHMHGLAQPAVVKSTLWEQFFHIIASSSTGPLAKTNTLIHCITEYTPVDELESMRVFQRWVEDVNDGVDMIQYFQSFIRRCIAHAIQADKELSSHHNSNQLEQADLQLKDVLKKLKNRCARVMASVEESGQKQCQTCDMVRRCRRDQDQRRKGEPLSAHECFRRKVEDENMAAMEEHLAGIRNVMASLWKA